LSLRNSNTYPEARLEKRRLLPWVIAALVFIYFAGRVDAVDPHRLLSQYSRDRWGSERGFPGGSVSAIAQSSDGYLWIGTDKGLLRFDGLNFRAFPRTVPGSAPIGPVAGLQADSEGNLWILLQSTNILRYHDAKFEFGRDQAEFGITALSRRTDGRVLFSSLVFGALTYNAGKFEILSSPTHEAPNSASSAPPVANDDLNTRLSWTTAVASHRLAEPNSTVVSIAETTDGKVWLGTHDSGLFYVSNGKVSAAGKDSLRSKIQCLLPLQGGKLWIGTENGILEWDGTQLTQTAVPSSLHDTSVLSMIRDHDSNIWVGTSNGLLRVNVDGVSFDSDYLGGAPPVTALFEDREGNVWLGSPRGIERLRDSAFVTYSVAGLQSQSGGPIYVDQEGRAWFAPIDGGLHWLKGEESASVTNDQLSQDVAYSIAGSKNDLWIGRQRGGLTHVSYRDGSVTTKTYTKADGLPENAIYAVYQGREGSVWAATLNAGVSQLKDGHFTTYTHAAGLASNTVSAMEQSTDGTMWFGTPNGLSSFSKGQWGVFTAGDGMPADNVNSLYSDATGVLWIGTASGIAFLRSGRVQVPTDEPAPLREQILGIAEDKSGRLWVATANHVLSVHRGYLLGEISASSDVREYGLEDGLHGTEGVRRQPSVFADAFGRVWFSLNRGLSVVDTTRATGSSAPAIVQIEGLSSDGNSIALRQPVRIPPGTHRVTFSYSGLSLAVPERVRYMYKLDGFDKVWSEPVSAHEAVYTNLRAGRYRFHVLASNSDGVWNDRAVTLDFSIAPAWFETSWVRVMFVLAIASIVAAFYRLRVQKIARAISARFDERLAERTRLARDLHDTFLQTVQGSKLVADDALDDSSDPARMRRAMEQLSNWLGQATQEGRAALNSLRTSTTERNDLAEALKRATESSFVPSAMAVTFSVLGDPREMHPIVRDEIYRVGYEAIRNAYTHSRATQVQVELRYAQDLVMRVSDNGVGIDPDVAEKGKAGHFGLQGMRERAARIEGKLTIVSSATSGTEITVIVPGRIVFRQQSAAPTEMIKRLLKRKS
jgi:ligand-binding sensor domain-containing protein/signal transduction histidine kinase